MPKRTLKRYDSQPAVTGGGGEAFSTAENIAAPVPAILEAPSNLVATSTEVARSAATPNAYVNLTWFAPNTAVTVTTYEIDVVRFGGVAERYTAYQTSAQIVLDAATQYAFRVRARYDYQVSAWSAAVIITTFADTTVPAVPTSPVLAFIGAGDAVITHVPATSTNYRDTEIKILSQAGGTLYGTFFDATGRMTWTTTQNNAATSGVGDVSLYVEMRSRSWSNVFSATVNTGLITKAAPTAPTVTADFSGVDCVYTIIPPADAAAIRFVADTAVTARDIGVVGRYAYVFDQNRLDHSGTADPVLSYSFTTVDGLGQASAATTGTATNAAPSAPTTVVVNGFLGVMSIAITTGTLPGDFSRYQVRVIQTLPTASDVVFTTTNTLLTRAIDTPATYQVGVRIVDAFSQTSTETLSTAIIIDALTIAQLRAETLYTDDVPRSGTVLEPLKDGNLSVGVSYIAGAHWTQAARPQLERFRDVTIAVSVLATGYLGFSKDGTTYDWYSGPFAADARTLTYIGTGIVGSAAETSANTVRVSLVNATGRFSLPTLVEARFVRLVHVFSTTAYNLLEFYPRRLVQSDDIEAEAVTAINIAAKTITAAQIGAGAITATEIASNTITAAQIAAGAITTTKLTAAAIDGMTITGATIRTAASGARVEQSGSTLKTTASDGTSRLVLNIDGAGTTAIIASSVYSSDRGYTFRNLGNQECGGIYSEFDASGSVARVLVQAKDPTGSTTSFVIVEAIGASANVKLLTANGVLTVGGVGADGARGIVLSGVRTSIYNGLTVSASTGAANEGINVGVATGATGGGIRASGGVNVGTATSATAGQIATSGNVGVGSAPDAVVRVFTTGQSATSSNHHFYSINSASVLDFRVSCDGTGYLRAAAWVYGSDARLKERINDYGGGLDIVQQLQPRQFSYIGNTAVEYGFIAQEVQKVLPNLVVTSEDGMLGLKTTNLIPVLVNAVKELQKRIEQLEQR